MHHQKSSGTATPHSSHIQWCVTGAERNPQRDWTSLSSCDTLLNTALLSGFQACCCSCWDGPSTFTSRFQLKRLEVWLGTSIFIKLLRQCRCIVHLQTHWMKTSSAGKGRVTHRPEEPCCPGLRTPLPVSRGRATLSFKQSIHKQALGENESVKIRKNPRNNWLLLMFQDISRICYINSLAMRTKSSFK